MDSQGLSITNVGKVRNKLKAVDDLATSTATFHAEAKDTTEASLQVSLSRFVVRVALKTRVRDPADIWAFLEVLRQGQGVLGMSLGA